MSLKEFDKSEIEKAKEEYAEEARERWGATPAYAESRKRTSSYKKEDWARIQKEMDRIFGDLGELMAQGADPCCAEAQALAQEWRDHITKNFYPCTKEMAAGLGRMYVEDPRFTRSLDTRYGEGVAQYIASVLSGQAG